MSYNVNLDAWSSCSSSSSFVPFHLFCDFSLNIQPLPLFLTSLRWGGLFNLRGSSVGIPYPLCYGVYAHWLVWVAVSRRSRAVTASRGPNTHVSVHFRSSISFTNKLSFNQHLLRYTEYLTWLRIIEVGVCCMRVCW